MEGSEEKKKEEEEGSQYSTAILALRTHPK